MGIQSSDTRRPGLNQGCHQVDQKVPVLTEQENWTATAFLSKILESIGHDGDYPGHRWELTSRRTSSACAEISISLSGSPQSLCFQEGCLPFRLLNNFPHFFSVIIFQGKVGLSVSSTPLPQRGSKVKSALITRYLQQGQIAIISSKISFSSLGVHV